MEVLLGHWLNSLPVPGLQLVDGVEGVVRARLLPGIFTFEHPSYRWV